MNENRKRSRSDPLTEAAVYSMHVNLTTKQLSHAGSPETVHKTCFYVGEKKLLTGESRHIWVTALHLGLELGMLVGITKSEKTTIDGTVIYTNTQSDIAIVETISSPNCDPLCFQSSRFASEKVIIAGFGDTMHGQDITPALVSCIIAKVEAGPKPDPKSFQNVSGSSSNQLAPGGSSSDQFQQWRTHRFFLLDKTTDFGFSGAPVVDDSGCVVGMLCASEYVNVSWALKSDFIVEGLDECVTE